MSWQVDWLAPRLSQQGNNPSQLHGDSETFVLTGPLEKITPNNNAKKRAPGDIFQAVIPPGLEDLKVWSQPPGVPLDQILTYAYEDVAPQQSRIYIIDGGASPVHAVSTH